MADRAARNELVEAKILAHIQMVNDKIDTHMDENGLRFWGVPIVRCTYASDSRFNGFLAVLRNDANKYFLDVDEDCGEVLKATLQFPIIEDKDTLEGATWREARKKFNTWVPQDMKNNPLTPTAPVATALLAKHNFKQDLEKGTHWNYFIYLDEASLASVLDTLTLYRVVE
jgi:hypothetical protein